MSRLVTVAQRPGAMQEAAQPAVLYLASLLGDASHLGVASAPVVLRQR